MSQTAEQEPVPVRRARSGTEQRLKRMQVGVRLDPMEHEALVLRAEIAGLTPADYLRKRALGGAAKIRRPPQTADQVTQALLKQLIGMVGALGNNVNQMAHAINIAALAGQPLPVEVDAVHDLNATLKAMRTELRELAGIRDTR